jgi:hypothetical protein
MTTFTVKAHWDAEARVWWAESDDIPGLVSEAETHDGLVENLRHVVPEILALNRPELRGQTGNFTIISDQIEEVCYA